MYTLLWLWLLSVVVILVRCLVVWPGAFNNSASSKLVQHTPTLSPSNSTVCPSYDKNRELTFTHSTSADYEFGSEYFCYLRMNQPHNLRTYAERRVRITASLDDGHTISLEDDQLHEFFTDRMFIIGGCGFRNCDSWTAVVTLTMFEEYTLADQFYLECSLVEVWSSSFWTSVCAVCAAVACVTMYIRVKTVGLLCICSLNYAAYLRSLTREQQHLLALNVCAMSVSLGAVLWLGFKYSLSSDHDKATAGAVVCAMMIKLAQSCFWTIFLSLMDITDEHSMLVWGFGLVFNAYNGALGWLGVLSNFSEPTFFAREGDSSGWIQLSSLVLYFGYYRAWQMISLRSWQYLDSHPYEEVRSKIIQFSYTQACTGLVGGTVVLSALIQLVSNNFGAYELWVFSIFPSIMGMEVVLYTVYLCLMLDAYSNDQNRDYRELLNIHEFNYSPYSQHCASSKQVYEHRRSCLVERKDGGYKDQIGACFDLSIARLAVLCSDQVYKCLEPEGAGFQHCGETFEPRDPSSLMNRCPRTVVVESVRQVDEENFEDTHMTFLKQLKSYRPTECTYAVSDFDHDGDGVITQSELDRTVGAIRATNSDKVERLILAFRGTFSASNALTDVDAAQVEYPLPEHVQGSGTMLVHRGFYTAWCLIRERVMNSLERMVAELAEKDQDAKIEVVVCGHSLGGGLATLCAAAIAFEWSPAQLERIQLRLYTFGSPRVVNRKLAWLLKRYIPDAFRVVNAGDPVTSVPKRFSHTGVQCGDRTYSHIGTCILLAGTHLVLCPQPIEVQLRHRMVVAPELHSCSAYESTLEICQRKHIKWLWKKAFMIVRMVVFFTRLTTVYSLRLSRCTVVRNEPESDDEVENVSGARGPSQKADCSSSVVVNSFGGLPAG